MLYYPYEQRKQAEKGKLAGAKGRGTRELLAAREVQFERLFKLQRPIDARFPLRFKFVTQPSSDATAEGPWYVLMDAMSAIHNWDKSLRSLYMPFKVVQLLA